MTKLGTIDKIFIGKIQNLWDGKEASGIAKSEVSGPQKIDKNGFVDDEQADRKHHGGPDMAIHYMPAERYDYWRSKFASYPQNVLDQLKPGRFGENLSARGLMEEEVCIGDIYQIGDLKLQVSQGREPCWKLCDISEIKEMAYWVRKTGYTGWYFRVLEAGELSAGAPVILIERPQPEWSLIRLNRAYFDKGVNSEEAAKLASIAELSEEWRGGVNKGLLHKNSFGFSV